MFGPPPSALSSLQKKEFETAEILQPETDFSCAEYRPQRNSGSTLPCNSELQRLLSRRTDQEQISALNRRSAALGVEARGFAIKNLTWAPKGTLIAHLHEHKSAVTRSFPVVLLAVTIAHHKSSNLSN